MWVCRLIFRKATGDLLVRASYNADNIPSLEDELRDFAVLNGYNIDALTIIDLPESDERFQDIVEAIDIKLENGELVYSLPQETELELPQEPDLILQVNEKVNLLIMMMLEREGIV